MERFYLLLCLFIASGCSIFDKEETVPGFVVITANDLETFAGQGANTINAPDVHVFANEQFVGTFELPATIPVLENGPTRINVSAGIKNNGISSNRIIYPFYAPLNREINLMPGVVTPINADTVPTYRYFPVGTLTFFLEEFEDIGTSLQRPDTSFAQLVITTDDEEVLSGNGSGKVVLNDSKPNFEARTTWNMTNLPKGQVMYLEIDFKGTNALEIWVRTLDPQINKFFVAGLVPQTEWTKVYIEMTGAIASQFQTNAFQLTFESRKPFSSIEETLFIDNIKFIYPN